MRRKIKGRSKIRVMPIGLQKRMLEKRFFKLNPSGDFDVIDLDILDRVYSFPENLERIQGVYPQYHWEIPKKKKASLKKKRCWETHVAGSKEIYTISVPIRPHKFTSVRKRKIGWQERNLTKKRKHYEHVHYEYIKGRIQVIVKKEWIGREAKIIVRIPRLSPENAD